MITAASRTKCHKQNQSQNTSRSRDSSLQRKLPEDFLQYGYDTVLKSYLSTVIHRLLRDILNDLTNLNPSKNEMFYMDTVDVTTHIAHSLFVCCDVKESRAKHARASLACCCLKRAHASPFV